MSAPETPGAEMEFRPMATFRGLRGVPIVAVTRNSLYPSVRIGDDHLVIRVIGSRRFNFDAIESVGVAQRLAYQVTVQPREGPWSFSANFATPAAAAELLQALAARGVPLAASASAFLEENAT